MSQGVRASEVNVNSKKSEVKSVIEAGGSGFVEQDDCLGCIQVAQ